VNIVHSVIPEISKTFCIISKPAVSGAEYAEHLMHAIIHVDILEDLPTCQNTNPAKERPGTTNWPKPTIGGIVGIGVSQT
jgi:hypothetical protein